MILFEKGRRLRYSLLPEKLSMCKEEPMSNPKIEQAREALAKVEAHVETLTPQTEARHQAERVRDNLSACIAMGDCNPKAAEILLPNVLTVAHEYLVTIGKN